MPWNNQGDKQGGNQGGGPWGGGGNNEGPWGGGSGRPPGRPTPPEFDKMFRDFRNQFGGGFPGGG